jgi:hypothetical protein
MIKTFTIDVQTGDGRCDLTAKDILDSINRDYVPVTCRVADWDTVDEFPSSRKEILCLLDMYMDDYTKESRSRIEQLLDLLPHRPR